ISNSTRAIRKAIQASAMFWAAASRCRPSAPTRTRMSDFIDVKDVYPDDPFGESSEGIPTGRDVEWEPLVDYRRNGVSENTIHGAVAWYSGSKEIHSFGGNVLCYGRSMMKPFYIKVFARELDP